MCSVSVYVRVLYVCMYLSNILIVLVAGEADPFYIYPVCLFCMSNDTVMVFLLYKYMWY